MHESTHNRYFRGDILDICLQIFVMLVEIKFRGEIELGSVKKEGAHLVNIIIFTTQRLR